MNFYKHHIGDYDADTAHLGWLEDAAYRRLICLYYRREQPIPADINQAARLVRAVSKQEREAVESVLREFFHLTDEGWRHHRCDAEIEVAERAAAKNRANGRSGGRPRKDESDKGGDTKPKRNPTETQSVSSGFRHARGTNSQTPDSITQDQGASAVAAPPPPARARAREEGPSPPPEPPPAPPPDPTPPSAAGLACRAMRAAGFADTNPADPRLQALLAQGVTAEELAGIAAEAVKARPPKGWGWVLATVQGRRTDAAAITVATAPPPDPMAWAESRATVEDMGSRLGLGPYEELDRATGRAIPWQAYRRRVIAAWEQRQQQGASA